LGFENEKKYFIFYASRNGKLMEAFLNIRRNMGIAKKSYNKTSSSVK